MRVKICPMIRAVFVPPMKCILRRFCNKNLATNRSLLGATAKWQPNILVRSLRMVSEM